MKITTSQNCKMDFFTCLFGRKINFLKCGDSYYRLIIGPSKEPYKCHVLFELPLIFKVPTRIYRYKQRTSLTDLVLLILLSEVAIKIETKKLYKIGQTFHWLALWWSDALVDTTQYLLTFGIKFKVKDKKKNFTNILHIKYYTICKNINSALGKMKLISFFQRGLLDFLFWPAEPILPNFFYDRLLIIFHFSYLT